MKKKIILIYICTLAILVSIIGYAYSFLTLNVSDVNKSETQIETEKLGLIYTGVTEIELADNMIAGDSFTKTFKVENTSNKAVKYNIYMENVNNTFARKQDLTYLLISDNGVNMAESKKLPSTINGKSYLKVQIEIPAKAITNYTIKIEYVYDPVEDQSKNMGKEFSATLGIDAEFNNVIKKELQSGIVLDVARRYYTVDEIKSFIDILPEDEDTFFLMHFSDDTGVGIESEFLNQTVANATLENGIYTNPNTNKSFLSFNQVNEIINYCNTKGVLFIPEIDIPAHMGGFFELARIKFGDEYVNSFARGTGVEAGMLDIVQESGKNFIFSIYDEYTEFFKNQEYFHFGFDEYTYRIDEKVDFANIMINYLTEKGFKPIMWNDTFTKENLNSVNKNVEIFFWNYFGRAYATVEDLQKANYKVNISNAYYLFFVPSLSNTNEHDLDYTVNDIINNWNINKWDNAENTTLKNYDNIKSTFIAVWGENSTGVSTDVILNQTQRMYNAMLEKNKMLTN